MLSEMLVINVDHSFVLDSLQLIFVNFLNSLKKAIGNRVGMLDDSDKDELTPRWQHTHTSYHLLIHSSNPNYNHSTESKFEIKYKECEKNRSKSLKSGFPQVLTLPRQIPKHFEPHSLGVP